MKNLWSRVLAVTRRSAPADLEHRLLESDLGPSLTAEVLKGARDPSSVKAALSARMSTASRELNLSSPLACVLLFGINGAGKTTTAGKLAHLLKKLGRNPLMVAADTYRAAAIEQAEVWAARAGVPCISGKAGGDPGAACYDGLEAARARGHDVAVVDTAGRLESSRNLMAELSKLSRIAARFVPDGMESLLVLDATVGQSSLRQAQTFMKDVGMTGLVLVKLDGSAKAGSVIAIENQLGIPVKLAGVGEGMDDLVPFDPNAFVDALVD